MAERCVATTKAGNPCPVPAAGIKTPGYCIGHDPGITLEMRQGFAKGKSAIRASGVRRLRSPQEIMEYVEEIIGKMEKTDPVLTLPTVEVLANLLRIQLAAIKEKSGGKVSTKTLGFRMKGVG